MKQTQNNSLLCNSPLMTSSNPLRKNNQGLLKDDSCLKFKMKETLVTGVDSIDSIDSPNIRKNNINLGIKQSRFGLQKKLLLEKDMNKYD